MEFDKWSIKAKRCAAAVLIATGLFCLFVFTRLPTQTLAEAITHGLADHTNQTLMGGAASFFITSGIVILIKYR